MQKKRVWLPELLLFLLDCCWLRQSSWPHAVNGDTPFRSPCFSSPHCFSFGSDADFLRIFCEFTGIVTKN